MFEFKDLKNLLRKIGVFLLIWCVVAIVSAGFVALEANVFGSFGNMFYGNSIIALLIMQSLKKKE